MIIVFTAWADGRHEAAAEYAARSIQANPGFEVCHALLVATVGTQWLGSPTFLPAVLVGVATVAAPLFVMQPAMGAGFASSRTRTRALNCLKSVANHAVFGTGLYLAAAAIAWIA